MKTKSTDVITVDELKAALPSKVRTHISQEIADVVNAACSGDNLILEHFRRNFFTYADVINEGSFTLDEYLNAIQFVTQILFGKTDIDAYAITFPEKYTELERKGYPRTEIGAWVKGYKKGKLVTMLLERSLVPAYITYAPLYDKMLVAAVDLATNAKSEMARAKAMELILTQLKMPETVKASLEIGIKPNKDLMTNIQQTIESLTQAQKTAIELKTNTVEEIAMSKIITEYVEAEVTNGE